MARFLALWSKPDDVEGFEEHYMNEHMALVEQWSDVQSTSVVRVTADPMGGEPPYHLIFEATFASQADLDGLMESSIFERTVADAMDIRERFGAAPTVLTAEEA